jgi:[ribosomal protein S5]-alanine N-acetyltransferase
MQHVHAMRYAPPEPSLHVLDLSIRRGRAADVPLILDYFGRNRAHLQPYSPTPPDNFYTLDHWRAVLRHADAAFAEDRQAHCFVYDADETAVLGVVNLSNFVRGAFHACYLGYSIDQTLQGTGRMSAAVEAVVGYAFEQLCIHRVMANYLTDNERSGRLLMRLGFEREGVAKSYLRIAGRWQDHVLTSRTNEAWREP